MISQRELETIASTSYENLATHPVASLVVAHVCGAIAEVWNGQPITTAEASKTEAIIEAPLRSALAACEGAESRAVTTAIEVLARAFLEWRRS